MGRAFAAVGQVLNLKFFNVNLFWCLHLEIISALEFNSFPGSALAIINFSDRHRSHFRDPQMYGADFTIMSHLMSKSTSLSLSVKMQLDNSVFDVTRTFFCQMSLYDQHIFI